MKRLLLSLLIVIAVLARARANELSSKEPRRDPKQAEFHSLQQRAANLAIELNSSNATRSRKAKDEWQKLVSDFDAWAKKYRVGTKQESTSPATSTGAAKRRCPPDHDYGRYFCILVEETPEKCVYRCYTY